MKIPALLLLAALTGPAAASPVHIALKPSASVSANADGFFTLGAVANFSGGAAAQRARLAAVIVGRAPLSGETRRLTRGDLALKLRQAGCDPDKVAVLEGADAAEVTTEEPDSGVHPGTGSPPGPPVRAGLLGENPCGVVDKAEVRSSSVAERPSPNRPARTGGPGGLLVPIPILIHRGDPLTIVIQTGPLTITAPGVAREGGGVGQTIRVHREGVMTDLSVQVMDAQTVHLEI